METAMHRTGGKRPQAVGLKNVRPARSDFRRNVARLPKPFDPSGQLGANLACRERGILRLLQKGGPQPMDRTQGGAYAGTIVQRQQIQGTGLTDMMHGDHDRGVPSGGTFQIAIGKRDDVIEIETQTGQLTCLMQRLRGTHTPRETLTASHGVGCENIIQFAGGVLDHGMIDAATLVGRIGLFAATYARHGDIRHRRARQGSHHEFASFGHKVNTNTHKA